MRTSSPGLTLFAGLARSPFTSTLPPVTAPGGAAGVSQNGRIAFEKGYGAANIEYDVPITPTSPFIMGSVSKQFTAAAIALLVEDGRLRLDDEVHKYVPELRDYAKPITID